MTSAANVYSSVINDVVTQVRECFLDESVDENVLQELKTIWTAKLNASKTVEQPQKAADAQLEAKAAAGGRAKTAAAQRKQQQAQQAAAVAAANQQQQHQQQQQAQGAAAGVPPASDLVLQMNEIVPVQITVPAQPGNPSSQPRTLTVKVPAHALQKTGSTSAMLQTLLQQAIAQALCLPDSHAAVFLQSQINSAFNLNQQPQQP